jgi:hypothetical protein
MSDFKKLHVWQKAHAPVESPIEHRTRFDSEKKHGRGRPAAESRPADSTRQVVLSSQFTPAVSLQLQFFFFLTSARSRETEKSSEAGA